MSRAFGSRFFVVRALALAALTVLAFLAPGSASAQGVWVKDGSVAPTQFTVLSNGSDYTRVVPFSRFQADVQLDSGASFSAVQKRAKRVAIWANIAAPPNQTFIGYASRYEKTYPVGMRPNDINSTVTVELPKAELEAWLLGICQRKLTQLRAGGYADREIFAHDYTTELQVVARGFIDWTMGADTDDYSKQPEPATLTCQKFEGPQVPTAGALQAPDLVVEVQRANLSVQPIAGLNGVCSVNLAYALKANRGDSEVTFRFFDAEGHSSETKTVTINALGLAVGRATYRLPGGGGARNGTIWMKGVGDFRFESNRVAYQVRCSEGGPAGLSAPGAVSPEPRGIGARVPQSVLVKPQGVGPSAQPRGVEGLRRVGAQRRSR